MSDIDVAALAFICLVLTIWLFYLTTKVSMMNELLQGYNIVIYHHDEWINDHKHAAPDAGSERGR